MAKLPAKSLFSLLTATCLAALAPGARADLLVLYGGSGAAGIVSRFDADTGTKTQLFGRENEGMFALAAGAGDDVFVSANILGSGLIYRFNRAGKFRSQVVEMNGTDFRALTSGPDGALYAAAFVTDSADPSVRRARILRIDVNTGASAAFIAEGAGGMTLPRALAFGADGALYVADQAAGVLRFDGATGAFRGVFVPVGRGGLADAAGFAFGPDGNLYVASSQANAVLRFNGGTGAYVDTFVVSGSGGLAAARCLAFGPDGNLYASSAGQHHVLRFSGSNGAFLGVFATEQGLRSPSWLAFTAPGNAGLPKLAGTFSF